MKKGAVSETAPAFMHLMAEDMTTELIHGEEARYRVHRPLRFSLRPRFRLDHVGAHRAAARRSGARRVGDGCQPALALRKAIGSTRDPLILTSKCRWLPNARPVAPTSPMT